MTAIDIDRRLLGAVRFLDATTLLPIDHPVDIQADAVRWQRNRSGLYVITEAPGLHEHTTSWAEQPGDVALGSVPLTITVKDPSGRYLARRRTVLLPRDPDPEHVPSTPPAKPADYLPDDDTTSVGSVFLPIDILLFPTPSSAVGAGWAVVHASVTGSTPDDRLPGALIRVVRDGDHLCSALSDSRGEALIAVAGIPVTTWTRGSGRVVATSVDVMLEVIHDPDAGQLPDPYDLEKRRAELLVRSRPATLVSGREISQTL